MTEKGSDEQLRELADFSLVDALVYSEEADHDAEDERLAVIANSDYVDDEPKQTQYKVDVPDPESDPVNADPLPPDEGEIK